MLLRMIARRATQVSLAFARVDPRQDEARKGQRTPGDWEAFRVAHERLQAVQERFFRSLRA